MLLLDRYIARELGRVIGLCLAIFVVLYLIVDFFERIDNFIEAQLPLQLAGIYFLLKTPLIIQQGIPMAVLIGILVALGLMARNNELTALKAGGISPLTLWRPIFTLALAFSLLDFALAEYLVPYTSTRANQIWEVQVNKRSGRGTFTQERVWYKGRRWLCNIRVLHAKSASMEGVTIYFFADGFQLLRRMDARRARWDGSRWIFTDAVLLDLQPDGSVSMQILPTYAVDLEEKPEDFLHLEKAPEEMTLGELRRYVAKIRSEGFDASRYLVDLHAKIAFPCISLVMALMATGIGLSMGGRGGIALGVATGMGLAFVYVVLFQLLLSLGYAGNLAPLAAAWGANGFFSLVGLLVFTRAVR